MFAHLRRALDLAARYDYEYWLQRKLTRWPALFAVAEARELLPPDLREQAAQTFATAPPETLEAAAPALPPKPVADLTIKMLGPVEIFRDPARPLAADADADRH